MKNAKYAIIILVAAVFGIGGGIVGQIISRVYLLEDAFDVPLLGEIDIRNNLNNPNLVISNPKKVVVEQDNKITESVSSAQKSVAAIFERAGTTTNEKEFSITDDKTKKTIVHYQRKKEIGQSFVVTSDGWLLSLYTPKELMEEEVASTTYQNVIKKYVVIFENNSVYDVDEIVVDKKSDYSFWKINDNDLPIKTFVDEKDINNGQLIMAINWDGDVWLSYVQNKKAKYPEMIKSSEKYGKNIIFSEFPNAQFKNSFLFNLSGDLVGIINEKLEAEPIGNYVSNMDYVLKNKAFKRASLGVNYINLSDIISDNEKYKKGAYLVKDEKGTSGPKGSAAEKFGLKGGDIITRVDDVEIGPENELCDLISKFNAGEVVTIEYIRGDKKENVEVILNELK